MEGGRDAQGRLSHVIFATQSIQEMKVRELEARQKLQETNEELTALLAEEKRHTSIIDALRNVFLRCTILIWRRIPFRKLSRRTAPSICAEMWGTTAVR